MYKQLRIISSEALGVEIEAILKNHNIKEYFVIEDIKSVWGERIKHLNNHIWPGADQVRIVVVSSEESEELLDDLKELKNNIKETLKMRIIVTTIDEII